MFNFLGKFFGEHDFGPLVKKINILELELEKLTDEELRDKSLKLKSRVNDGENLDGILPEAFALVREASKRTLGQRHFDVQLIGGIVLHQGKIAEMMTGEGKTLSATSPAYLNALMGKGVHVITVNDYLARRDAVWMGQIYYALGLSVGCLTHEAAYIYDPGYKIETSEDNVQADTEKLDKERDTLGAFKVVHEFLRPVSRKEAYSADITYGTNHEFGFDYLRDNLVYDPNGQVQHGHHYAIIDEVDSILIDEARTPLIISAPDAESSDYYRLFAKIIDRLSKDEDYAVDEKMKTVSITDEGINKVEKILKIENIYSPENLRLVHYLEASLKAKALFNRDKQYVVRNNEIIIVDEFTGRLMHGRRYSAGLHQAIEAKENVHVQQESRTFAQITIQNYFRLYEKISGMTGTAQTSAEEFHKVYNLEAVSIPSNKPLVRKDNSDLIYKTLETKYRAVVEEVKKRHANGQPVLIGTTSITNNELVSMLLNKFGVPHEVLNAKNHEREGAIIAQAGKSGAVTVATNMAGRGVDIVFGGNPPDSEAAKKIRELGGLYVIGTERHEARRIDNQLRGRSGRQGDPGETQFFLSLEDDLMRIFGGERIKSLMERFKFPDDQPIESQMVSKVVNEAQKKVEGFNFDSRKHLLEYDDIFNKQRTAFYKKRQDLLKQRLEIRDEGLGNDNMEDGEENKEINISNEQKNNLRLSSIGMLDVLWMNHLENMEALRESVGMRAYGQHDPLVEYRRESYTLFKGIMEQFEDWLKEQIIAISARNVESGGVEEKMEDRVIVSPFISAPVSQDAVSKKVGRNDPCWCGAKKADGTPIKYKHCHGK